jgi:hypothetical protein
MQVLPALADAAELDLVLPVRDLLGDIGPDVLGDVGLDLLCGEDFGPFGDMEPLELPQSLDLRLPFTAFADFRSAFSGAVDSPRDADILDRLFVASLETALASQDFQWSPKTRSTSRPFCSTVPSLSIRIISGRTNAMRGFRSSPQQLSKITRCLLNNTRL